MQNTPEQDKIFQWFQSGNGNLVVEARAGAGKTTTILAGIQMAPEKKALLVAFNKAIATELEHKLAKCNKDIHVSTLHALGYRLLRQSGAYQVDEERRQRGFEAWLWPSGSKAIPWVSKRGLFDLCKLVRETQPDASQEEILKIAINFDIRFDTRTTYGPFWGAETCHKLVQYAKNTPPDGGKVDFADMIFLPTVWQLMKPAYDLVVVDEAQDMTAVQLGMIKHLVKPGGRIVVVGDPYQAIYAWRGAHSNGIALMKQELKAVTLPLTVTFRCSKRVVIEANNYVPDIRAKSGAELGGVKAIDLKSQLFGMVQPGDYIIARTNAFVARSFVNAIRQHPAAIMGGLPNGVLEVINQVRTNTKQPCYTVDQLIDGLERKRRQEVLKAEIETKEWAAKLDIPHSVMFDAAVLQIDEKYGFIAAFTEACRGKSMGLFDELVELAKTGVKDQDKVVVCSTVHRIKGKEANRVFLIQDSFKGAKLNPESQEERNLQYVAITRAKHTLYHVHGKF